MSKLAKGRIPKSWNKEVIDYLKGDGMYNHKFLDAKPKDKMYKIYDSGGLYLLIMPNGAKYWRLKYRFAGRENTLALGIFPIVSLQDARRKRDDAKKILDSGNDPREFTKGKLQRASLDQTRKYTITTPSEYEMKLFLSAREFKIALDDIREYIRNQLKYAELDEDEYKTYEGIQAKVFEILDETSYFKLSDDA